MKKMFVVMLMVTGLMFASTPNVFAAGDFDGETILAPYWAATATHTAITFLAITNPSITGADTRTVTVNALKQDGTISVSRQYAISAGTTQKILILSTPALGVGSVDGSSRYDEMLISPASDDSGQMLLEMKSGDSASSISVFGALYYLNSDGGFAMEFIGDITDSTQDGSDANGL